MNRIKRMIFPVLAGVLVSSCQSSLYRMAYRPEPNLGLAPTQTLTVPRPELIPTKPLPEMPVNTRHPELILATELDQLTEVSLKKDKPKARNRSSKGNWKENLGISQSSKKKPAKKERRPLFRPNNDGFWIGGGLLGIAMLLTILNFPSLALLFGLVSLLFFIFAIKKALRRNRRRQRFKARQRK